MVNPPTNTSTSVAVKDVQLNASTSDTLRYLAGRVGEIIEARVVKVTTALTTDIAKASAELGSSSSVLAKAAQAAIQTAAQPAKATATNFATTTATATTNATSGGDYEVILNVGNQQITVKSPLAPRLGQLLELQILSSQQLRIVEAKIQNASANIDLRSNINRTGNPEAVAAAAKTSAVNQATQTNNPIQNAATLTAKQLAILHTALRDNLPRQTSRANLLTSLQNLSSAQPSGITNSTTNSIAINNPALSKELQTLQAAIESFKNSTSTLADLVRPTNLKQALQNSGLFYEAKVSALTKPASANQNTTAAQLSSRLEQTINTGLPTSKQAIALSLGLQSIPAFKPNSGQNIASNNSINIAPNLLMSQTINPLASQIDSNLSTTDNRGANTSAIDNKLGLLKIIDAVKILLAASTQSSSTGAAKSSLPPGDNASLPALWQWASNQISSRSQLQNSGNNGDDGLLQLLRMALAAVSRTQSHQLLSMSAQLASTTDNSVNQSWSTELPFWVDQKLSLIDIRVDAEKYAANANRAEEKVWNARLQFDLDDHGKLVAFATLRGKTIAAMLWATEAATAERVNDELRSVAVNLETFGLQVHNLQCRVGEPEQTNSNGTINLLDTEI